MRLAMPRSLMLQKSSWYRIGNPNCSPCVTVFRSDQGSALTKISNILDAKSATRPEL
jgi:hypothetical protein